MAPGLEPGTTGLTTPRLSRDIRGYVLSSVVYFGLDLSAHVRNVRIRRALDAHSFAPRVAAARQADLIRQFAGGLANRRACY